MVCSQLSLVIGVPSSRPPFERKQGDTSALLSGSAAAHAKNFPARSAVIPLLRPTHYEMQNRKPDFFSLSEWHQQWELKTWNEVM
jgi:hypothetical protein